MKIISSLCLLVIPFTMSQECSKFENEGYENLINRFHEYVDQEELPGTVIFIEKDGVLQTDIYGYQDIGSQTRLTENSIFRLASMTKPLVATAILQLVEKGTLQLDDPVASYIPEVAQMRVYDGTDAGQQPRNAMTIRQLLSHTSGSTSGFDFSDAGKATHQAMTQKKAATLKELTQLVCSTQLAFEPGEGWAYGYSNDLLAYIIEQQTGVTIDQYLKTHVLEPLEMYQTAFQVENPELLTSVYATAPNGGLEMIETAANSKYIDGRNMARGNGGLAGTAGDYLNFCRMILNEGTFKGKELLQPSSVKLMMENVVPAQFFPIKVANNEMIGQGYGLGFGVVMNSSPFGTPGDVYWPGALYTYFFISPENNAIALFMTQLYDMNKMGLIWEFHDLATKAL